MIKIEVGPRLIKTLRRLGPDVHAQTEKKLAQIARDFGSPHSHSGLGIRKIGRHSFEARIGLHWRIALIQESDRLLAYNVMTHEEILRWLKR